jgi:hypothetical protein
MPIRVTVHHQTREVEAEEASAAVAAEIEVMEASEAEAVHQEAVAASSAVEDQEEAEEDLRAAADMVVAEEADLEEAHSKVVFYIHSSQLPKNLSCHMPGQHFQTVLKQSTFSHSSTNGISLLLYAFTHAN